MKDETDLTADRIEDLTIFIFELYGVRDIDKTQEVTLKKILLSYYKEFTDNHSLGSFYSFI